MVAYFMLNEYMFVNFFKKLREGIGIFFSLLMNSVFLVMFISIAYKYCYFCKTLKNINRYSLDQKYTYFMLKNLAALFSYIYKIYLRKTQLWVECFRQKNDSLHTFLFSKEKRKSSILLNILHIIFYISYCIFTFYGYASEFLKKREWRLLDK